MRVWNGWGCGIAIFRALNFQISEPEIWQKLLFLRNFRDFPGKFGLRKIFFGLWKWPFHTPPIHTPTKCRPILKPVPILKHAARTSTQQTSMRAKWLNISRFKLFRNISHARVACQLRTRPITRVLGKFCQEMFLSFLSRLQNENNRRERQRGKIEREGGKPRERERERIKSEIARERKKEKERERERDTHTHTIKTQNWVCEREKETGRDGERYMERERTREEERGETRRDKERQGERWREEEREKEIRSKRRR